MIIKIRAYTSKERKILGDSEAYQVYRKRIKNNKKLQWAEGQKIHTQEDVDRLTAQYGFPNPQQAWDAMPQVINEETQLIFIESSEICRNFLSFD